MLCRIWIAQRVNAASFSTYVHIGGQNIWKVELILAISEGISFKTIFRFWFFVSFGDEVMKIRKYYVIFVCILQGKMGKTEKKPERKSHN